MKTESIASEDRLPARIAQGDAAAFAELMRTHNRRLYRLARALLRNDAEAEDALQEAYLSAYRAIEGFRGEAQLFTWLAALVRNECLGRLRRDQRRGNILPMLQAGENPGEEIEAMADTEKDRPDQQVLRAQLRALLERKLDDLPEAYRTVFVLRAVEEMSVEETAQCLAIPEATVRTRLFRARSLLREALAQDIDLAERDVFDFMGERCDRIVATVLERLSREG